MATNTSCTVAASKLKPGAWSARWGECTVLLKSDSGRWNAKVLRQTSGGGYTERMQLGACQGFETPMEATEWACDVLRENGAKVMILDSSITLEQLLEFRPAPEAVT